MKIVLTKRTPLSVPDGISHFLFSLADALLAQGHDITCLTTRDRERERIADRFRYPRLPEIRVLTEKTGTGYPFEVRTWLVQGRTALRALRPDLVIVNGAIPCRPLCPSVTVAHDVDRRTWGGFSWPRRLFKAATYRLTDRLVTTCSELVPAVARDALFPAARIGVIPTCVTPELYRPRPLAERKPLILHVGMQVYKNPLGTLRAFLPLAGDARLRIVGKVDPGVKAFVDGLPAAQRMAVELPGIVSDDEMKESLASARVISVPSRYDAPVASPTVLEAFAAHTPAVVSAGISRDLAHPGRNCLAADDDSTRTEAFRRLLSDDDAWTSLSQGAAATVERFSAASVARRYLDLLGR